MACEKVCETGIEIMSQSGSSHTPSIPHNTGLDVFELSCQGVGQCRNEVSLQVSLLHHWNNFFFGLHGRL